MIDILRTCCFTGYRPEKFDGWNLPHGTVPEEVENLIEEAIIRAYKNGYTFFISGMSRGFDLWAAKQVIKLKKNYPIKLFCAIPFDEQSIYWSDSLKKQYDDIILKSDYVCSMTKEYKPSCFYIRNRFMVDRSSRIICWFDGTQGGTAFTFRYAKRKGITIDNLYERQLKIY